MKRIIITIITIFVAIISASCHEKSDAEKYIAECNHCESVIITEFGNIQKFPYATRKVIAWSLFTAKEATYVAECTVNAFHAKNVNEAIEMLIECKDSTYRFIDRMPSSNTIEKFTRHEEGDNGVIITNQRLVKEFREIIVAIDEEIINELSKLFMGIY